MINYISKYLVFVIIVIIIFFVFQQFGDKFVNINEELPADSFDNKTQYKQYDNPPEMSIDTNKKYFVNLETSKGDIRIELFADEAPITVNNFVFLARDGFYDGLKFHRIVKDFMIQGGDPKGDGTGGPGYQFDDEPITRDYKRGIVAMANSGPNTNGSQFFIMHKDTDLQKNYTIFGQVVEGMDIVDKIAETPTTGPENSIPIENVVINKLSIEEK